MSQDLLPVVPVRTNCAFYNNGVTGVVSPTLISLTPVRTFTAGSAGTTMTVTTGKTLRITQITLAIVNVTTATMIYADMTLVAKASGTIATSDPTMWRGRVSNSSATLNNNGTTQFVFPDGIELPSGAVFGLVMSASSTNSNISGSITGYEY